MAKTYEFLERKVFQKRCNTLNQLLRCVRNSNKLEKETLPTRPRYALRRPYYIVKGLEATLHHSFEDSKGKKEVALNSPPWRYRSEVINVK